MRRRDFFKKSQQRKYARRSYRNPYFQKKRDPRTMRILIGVCSMLALIALIAGFIFLHPMFAIARVHVIGVEHLDRSRAATVIRTSIRHNRFLFRADALEQTLRETFALRDVTVAQQGAYVEVRLVERTSQLIWKSAGEGFVVDLDGVVIRMLAADELEHLVGILPLFVDRNDVHVGVGDHVLTRQEGEAIVRFQEHLAAQNIRVVQTEFDRLSGKWIGVLTDQDYHILFDPSTDVDVQAGRLEVLMKEKISDPADLQYIDLRFGDHVYFK